MEAGGGGGGGEVPQTLWHVFCFLCEYIEHSTCVVQTWLQTNVLEEYEVTQVAPGKAQAADGYVSKLLARISC